MEAKKPRGRGRPKREITDKLRTQVWVLAVEQASGLSANALEILFRGIEEGKSSTGLWSKYARGTVSPNLALIDTVESTYPQTARWFRHLIWDLLREPPSTLDGLKKNFFALPLVIRKQLVFEKGREEAFWRRPGDIGTTYRELLNLKNIEDALAGLILLMREAEFRQNAYQLQEGVGTWRLLRQRLRAEWPFSVKPQNQKTIFLAIEELLLDRWSGTRFTNDGVTWTPGTI